MERLPEDVWKWLEDFRIVVETKGPTVILNHLVQMGVSTLDRLQCECHGEILENAALWWCHEHHVELNCAVYAIISAKPGLVAKLRRVVREDLKTPDIFFEGDEVAFGKIVKKSYGQDLLDHFLTQDPAWCLKQREEAPVA